MKYKAKYKNKHVKHHNNKHMKHMQNNYDEGMHVKLRNLPRVTCATRWERESL